MMADELTQEEKDAAEKLKSAAENDKSKLDKIGDSVNTMTDLLKSQVAAKEVESKEEKKTEDIDYASITPEDMAKSFADKDQVVDFIKGLCEYADVQPVDMQNEDGAKLISEEMWKSMQEATDDDMGVKSAIMFSMQEAGERNVHIHSTVLHSLVEFGKGMSALTSEISQLNKSLVPPAEKTDAEKEAENIEKIPDLDGAAGEPKSKHDLTKSTEASSVAGTTELIKAINSEFTGSYDTEAQLKRSKYVSYAQKMSHETALIAIGQDSPGDLALIQNRFPLN